MEAVPVVVATRVVSPAVPAPAVQFPAKPELPRVDEWSVAVHMLEEELERPIANTSPISFHGRRGGGPRTPSFEQQRLEAETRDLESQINAFAGGRVRRSQFEQQMTSLEDFPEEDGYNGTGNVLASNYLRSEPCQQEPALELAGATPELDVERGQKHLRVSEQQKERERYSEHKNKSQRDPVQQEKQERCQQEFEERERQLHAKMAYHRDLTDLQIQLRQQADLSQEESNIRADRVEARPQEQQEMGNFATEVPPWDQQLAEVGKPMREECFRGESSTGEQELRQSGREAHYHERNESEIQEQLRGPLHQQQIAPGRPFANLVAEDCSHNVPSTDLVPTLQKQTITDSSSIENFGLDNIPKSVASERAPAQQIELLTAGDGRQAAGMFRENPSVEISSAERLHGTRPVSSVPVTGDCIQGAPACSTSPATDANEETLLVAPMLAIGSQPSGARPAADACADGPDTDSRHGDRDTTPVSAQQRDVGSVEGMLREDSVAELSDVQGLLATSQPSPQPSLPASEPILPMSARDSGDDEPTPVARKGSEPAAEARSENSSRDCQRSVSPASQHDEVTSVRPLTIMSAEASSEDRRCAFGTGVAPGSSDDHTDLEGPSRTPSAALGAGGTVGSDADSDLGSIPSLGIGSSHDKAPAVAGAAGDAGIRFPRATADVEDGESNTVVVAVASSIACESKACAEGRELIASSPSKSSSSMVSVGQVEDDGLSLSELPLPSEREGCASDVADAEVLRMTEDGNSGEVPASSRTELPPPSAGGTSDIEQPFPAGSATTVRERWQKEMEERLEEARRARVAAQATQTKPELPSDSDDEVSGVFSGPGSAMGASEDDSDAWA